MKAKTKTFEEKMQRLEEIVRAMELVRSCGKQLEEAKMQVTKITAGADGAPQEEPFADEI